MHFSWMNEYLMWIMGILPRWISILSYFLGIVCIMQAARNGLIQGSYPFRFAWNNHRLQSLSLILLGTILIYFPSTIHFSAQSILKLNHLGSANDLIAYHALYQPEMRQEMSDIMIKYSSLIGIIAFIRGWALLVRKRYLGEMNKTAKAILYMIGSILLINIIYATVNM